MNNSKALTALGFAQRAGKCVCGETGCDAEMTAHRVFCIAVDALASDNTKIRWQRRCKSAGIFFAVLDGAANAVGKPGKMIFAVSDAGFSQMICKALSTGQE